MLLPYNPNSSNNRFLSPYSFLFSFVVLLLLTTTTTTSISNAQSIPTPRRRVAFVKYNNQFYIQGGLTTNAAKTSDLYALNLNTTWPATASSWTTLAGGNWAAHHAMVAVKPEHSAGLGTGTGGYLLSIGGYPAPSGGFWSAYDIQTGTWNNLTTPAPYPGLEGHTAVSDPHTGLVYVMGGYYINNVNRSSQVANDLTVFDPKTGKVVQQTVASQYFNTTGSSAVWSTRRKSVLLFQGFSIATNIDAVYGVTQNGVRELNVTSGTWSNMTTLGTFPIPRLDSCTAESEDGSIIMLVGGAQTLDRSLATVDMLDIATGQWSTGPNMPAPRSQFACTSYSRFFLVYGGTSSMDEAQGILFPTQPLIMDTNKNIWVDHEEARNRRAIIGGAVGGGVAFLGVCTFAAVWFHRRRKSGRTKSQNMMESGDAKEVSTAWHSGGGARGPQSDEKQSGSSEKDITAAGYYAAAAQAAAESHTNRNKDASGERGELSWSSETLSQANSSGTDSTLLRKASERRQLSEATTLSLPSMQDPVAYYQRLLDQQRQLQRQHPELFSPRNPQAVLEGQDDPDSAPLEIKGEPPEQSSSETLFSLTLSSDNKSNKSYNKPWVPPLGLQDLMVPTPPGSPHTWSHEVAAYKEDMLSLGKSDSQRSTTPTAISLSTPPPTTPVSVIRAISLTKKKSSIAIRSPHTHITTSAMDVILSPNKKTP